MFTLTLLPDGRAVLTTEEDLSQTQVAAINDSFERWRTSSAGTLVIANCRIEDRITSVEWQPEAV